MSILTGTETIKPYIKRASGYIKSLLSSQHVVMKNGETLQTAVDEINNNLAYEFGNITVQGTPQGCNVTVSPGNSWYMKIGKLVTFCTEMNLTNNGSNQSIFIPCLPYVNKCHCSFYTGYQTLVAKANGNPADVTSVLKAAAYGNSKELYLLLSNGGRMYNMSGNELTTNGVILINGFYFTEE